MGYEGDLRANARQQNVFLPKLFCSESLEEIRGLKIEAQTPSFVTFQKFRQRMMWVE